MLPRRSLLGRPRHHAVRGRSDPAVRGFVHVVRDEERARRDRRARAHGGLRLRGVLRRAVYAGEDEERM